MACCLCGHVVSGYLVQGVTTLSFVLGCWALARGVGVPARARLAANCVAAMAMTQARHFFSEEILTS